MARNLSPEERALWRKVIESVRPLKAQPTPPSAPPAVPAPLAAPASIRRRPPAPPPTPPVRQSANTLDASWDRRLARGLVSPDQMVDLHGHTLDTAYSLLDSRLEEAISSGARLILLVTGKPPLGEPPVARGKIRAAVGDWLASSRHAGSIAAVRAAHPRHGGAGALYIVLRRTGRR